ncbi:TPA: GAF domain-containing protein [bacterium]|nr:GAF domain-containing protein [bacterium]
MSEVTKANKIEKYELIIKQAESLIDKECNYVTNLSNLSALLFAHIENINWAGFYLTNNDELHLGPFQGEVACTRIKIGKGVCGTSMQRKETIIVPNVHEFEGHIACSDKSNSEIVVPIIKNDQVLGVIDIDSPLFNNFDEVDQKYLEQLSTIIANDVL